MARFISAYTPSNTDPEVLQRLFVQREPLLKQIVLKLERSMLTGDKHHILLIGPRGSGKTNLLTLAHHRLMNQADKNLQLANQMRVAWLNEDATFTDLVDIALAIADALSAAYPDEFTQNYRQLARNQQGDQAAEIILNALRRDLGSKAILLMMENMDRMFSNIGEMGQKTWRAFLQEKQCIATLATAQDLVSAVSSRDEPFYGFFGIEHLEPLSSDEAHQLIANIAALQGNESLASYLKDPAAKYRIRALHYLAGGNHRMYVLLSELLNQENLADLVQAFVSLADELTPYFQERLRALPGQQAKIVEYLCTLAGAASVKTIAEDTFIAETSCSKQLGELKHKRYVRATKQGKESLYEMNEPLMRLCMDVKKQRGTPLKLVTQFMRAWFSDADLKTQMTQLKDAHTQRYCAAALDADPIYAQALNAQLEQLINDAMSEGKFESADQMIAELSTQDAPAAKTYKQYLLLEQAKRQFKLGEWQQAIDCLKQLLDSPEAPIESKYHALTNRGICYVRQGNIEAAMADYSTVIDSPETPIDAKCRALISRGVCHSQKNNIEAGMADYNAVVDLPNAPVALLAEALMSRAVVYWRQAKHHASVTDFSQVLHVNSLSGEQRTFALFAIAEPLTAIAPLSDVRAALERAFIEGEETSAYYGGTPHDLLKMVLQLGSMQWQGYIEALLPLFVRYKQTDKLASGLVQSIGSLTQMDLSHTQLDAWLSAWQEAAGDVEALELPITALAASIESIKTKSSRPLFLALPLEIRQLVLPLLEHLWVDSPK